VCVAQDVALLQAKAWACALAFMYATLQHYLLPPYGQLGGLDLLCKSVSTYCLPIRCPPQMYTEQPHLCAYAGQGHMIPASCLE